MHQNTPLQWLSSVWWVRHIPKIWIAIPIAISDVHFATLTQLKERCILSLNDISYCLAFWFSSYSRGEDKLVTPRCNLSICASVTGAVSVLFDFFPSVLITFSFQTALWSIAIAFLGLTWISHLFYFHFLFSIPVSALKF